MATRKHNDQERVQVISNDIEAADTIDGSICNINVTYV